MWIGQNESYHWIVPKSEISGLADILLKHNAEKILHITAFDSGSVKPTSEEITAGWSSKNRVMISPSLNSTIEVPYEQYDEWYLSDTELDFPDDLEIFVNYTDFSLASPVELTKEDDPTWERGRYDFLYQLQKRFWNQLKKIDAETYIAIGENDIVVSKNEGIINCIKDHC